YLRHANFSGAIIDGADFTAADLTNASFSAIGSANQAIFSNNPGFTQTHQSVLRSANARIDTLPNPNDPTNIIPPVDLNRFIDASKLDSQDRFIDFQDALTRLIEVISWLESCHNKMVDRGDFVAANKLLNKIDSANELIENYRRKRTGHEVYLESLSQAENLDITIQYFSNFLESIRIDIVAISDCTRRLDEMSAGLASRPIRIFISEIVDNSKYDYQLAEETDEEWEAGETLSISGDLDLFIQDFVDDEGQKEIDGDENGIIN
ncbi:MAG: pentapeptide repeat-containing protein, partial [Elainellaceae cyanobacterium]